MNNLNKIIFTLRQHTPLIHFQWYEEGASIRPTELKAKLDKWLIAQETNCHGNAKERLMHCFGNPDLKKWLKGSKDKDKTHPAFNYSIIVRPIGANLFKDELDTKTEWKTRDDGKSKEVIINNDYPPYFGNQLKTDEYHSGEKRIKRLVFHSVVQVIIHSQFEDLVSKINREFPLFILKTNFGTRQGKGCGSFYLDGNDPCFPKEVEIENEISNKFDWKFDVKVSGDDEPTRIRDLFRQIDLFYKTLRSGIHPRGTGIYFKSLMFKYVMDVKDLQWDKKTIKQRYFLNETMNPDDNEASQKLNRNYLNRDESPKDETSPLFWDGAETNDKLLWRDILGLSTLQKWGSYNKDIFKKHFPEESDFEIIRFKSPIIFKPLRKSENEFRILFEVPRHIAASFSDVSLTSTAEEAFILGKKINIDTRLGDEPTWGLNFPNTFSFNEFFINVLNTNPKSHVKVVHGDEGNRNLSILVQIYSQLSIQVEHKLNKKT